jgi:hypothetical protein
MLDAKGRPIDMGQYGMPMGGQWATPGLWGPHASMPHSTMGPGSSHANGSHGMVFGFTTA